MKSIIYFSQSGCLLPLLIIFNLFFGWIFLKPLTWIAAEGILVLLFFINSFFLARSILKPTKKRSGVIDVEGQILEEKLKLK